VDRARPLALVDSDDLLDDLLRVAAAAGCEVDRAADLAAVRAGWAHAPMVVLDERAARRCGEAGLPRRPGVVLLAAGQPPPVMFEHGVAVGAERVVGLPDAESWLAGAIADAVEGPAKDTGRVMAVIGGRGGAGASVFTAAAGYAALRRGRRVLLVDCDPMAGGLDLVLGAERLDGLRWPELKLSAGRVAASSLHSALPGNERGQSRLTILSCDRANAELDPQAVATVVSSARRGGELVICDLPRHATEPSRVVLDRADLIVVVVPAELRACAAARRLVERFIDEGREAQLVVRGPAPGGLKAEEVASTVGLNLLAHMVAEPGLSVALEAGRPPSRPRGPLAVAADLAVEVLCGVPDAA
jgi:secretion/DNA translocation related CpaE-like protein